MALAAALLLAFTIQGCAVVAGAAAGGATGYVAGKAAADHHSDKDD